MRAALEKSELERQRLGYEYDQQAAASRELTASAANKEASLEELNAALQRDADALLVCHIVHLTSMFCTGQVGKLTHKVAELEDVAQHQQKKHEAERESILAEMKIKVTHFISSAPILYIVLSRISN